MPLREPSHRSGEVPALGAISSLDDASPPEQFRPRSSQRRHCWFSRTRATPHVTAGRSGFSFRLGGGQSRSDLYVAAKATNRPPAQLTVGA
jgi:hypothetical protein